MRPRRRSARAVFICFGLDLFEQKGTTVIALLQMLLKGHVIFS